MVDGNGVRAAATGLPAINTTVPHPSRVWDYWLGGHDNFAVDRRLGDRIRRRFPVLVDTAAAGRQFLARAVHHLAADAGVDQFLDLGSGLPTAGNTHAIAQAAVPHSRIVYVDNDPLVVVHARTLLSGTSNTAYIDADIRDPGSALADAARTLDFTRPVAVVMLAVLDALHDDTDVRRLVTTVVAAVPSGSYLVLTHATLEPGSAASPYGNTRTRTPAQLAALLTGLEPVEPGLVPCTRWRPAGPATDVPLWGAVARKP